MTYDLPAPPRTGDPASYGDSWAAVYDLLHPQLRSHDPLVQCVRRLAGSGPVLELGIGTGRIAIPLREAGLSVDGIDSSSRMIRHLKEKEAAAGIGYRLSSFEDFSMPRRYSLVLLATNTIFALMSGGAVISCFRAVSRHLVPGGRFVIDAFVPDERKYAGPERQWEEKTIRHGHEMKGAHHLDPSTRLVSSVYQIRFGSRVVTLPVELRLCCPGEMDAAARSAGLIKENEWSDWTGRAFGPDSEARVTVYRRLA